MEAASTMVVDGKVPSREAEGRNGRVGVRKDDLKTGKQQGGGGERGGRDGWLRN